VNLQFYKFLPRISCTLYYTHRDFEHIKRVVLSSLLRRSKQTKIKKKKMIRFNYIDPGLLIFFSVGGAININYRVNKYLRDIQKRIK